MKKALASALALTMVAGLTSVAFASTTDAVGIEVDTNSKIYIEREDDLVEIFDTTKDLMVAPGHTIYVELLGIPAEGQTEAEITSKLAGQHKVVMDWSQGKDLVDGVAIINKKVPTDGKGQVNSAPKYGMATKYADADALKAAAEAATTHTDMDSTGHDFDSCTDATHQRKLSQKEIDDVLASYKAEQTMSYKYVAEIKVKSSYSAKQMDLLGTMKVMKKSQSANSDVNHKAINAVVGYEQMKASESVEVSNDAPVVDFDDVDEEIELLFGNNASFLVNVKNQGNLYLGYSLKPNTDVMDQNKDANIDFISFPAKPSFNRIGKLHLYADKDAYIYELTGNGLKKLNAKYDEDYEAHIVETRALGSYVISDTELKYTSVEGDNSSSSGSSSNGSSSGSTGGSGSNGGSGSTGNPNTGAGAMTAVAMGMAGVSLVAGVASKKKQK